MFHYSSSSFIFMPSFTTNPLFGPSFPPASTSTILLCTCPNHFSRASLNLSPNHSTWAVLLKCFFLILSILVTSNKNLSIFSSASSTLSTFHFILLSGFCYPTQTPTAALLEGVEVAGLQSLLLPAQTSVRWKDKTLQMSNKLPGCHFSLIPLFRLDTDTNPCDISPTSESL